jgi:hypothetical protein
MLSLSTLKIRQGDHLIPLTLHLAQDALASNLGASLFPLFPTDTAYPAITTISHGVRRRWI